ncbi:MAG: TatD family hydrolase [Candidatus Omnitrophica bacterium]|nr:TatD family hydrolase [Candidatus Omnitrophota bacterium]
MLVDTHCHLNFSQFDADRDLVIKRAQEQDVKIIINVAADMATSKQSVDLAASYTDIFAAVGVHPHYVNELQGEKAIEIIRALAKNTKVVAIGEVGLDYYRFGKTQSKACGIDESKAKQRRMLAGFMQLAAELKLPLIFHCRDAAQDMLSVITKEGKAGMRGVMHCFSQDKKFLRTCLDLGLYISFTANITYKNSQNLRELVSYTPLKRLLLETDAPYLAPQTLRGKRNEPAYLKFTAQEIAGIKRIATAEICRVTTENAYKLFSLN